jgi:Arc/MetJ-type ribon-helix-helix transcriptional regulator
MPQTTIRVSEELLEEIDEETGPEESRSEWIREACRERLSSDDLPERVTELERRLERIERERERSLLTRLFG